VLLNATPDTKIEMVPTQNPSKRTAVEAGERAAAPAAPRRHSTSAIPRRRASKVTEQALFDPIEFVGRTSKKARTAAQAPSSEAGSPTTARQYTFMPNIASALGGGFPHLPNPAQLGCITHFNEPYMQHPSPYQCSEVSPNHHSQPSFPVSGSVDSHHPRRMSIDQLVYHADPLPSPTSPPASRLTSEMESLVIWANLERQQLTSNHSN